MASHKERVDRLTLLAKKKKDNEIGGYSEVQNRKLLDDHMINLWMLGSQTRDDYLENRRGAYGNPEEYDKRYEDLPHLFFDRTQLSSDLIRIGFKQVTFFPHRVPNGSSKFRFNVLAEK